MVLYRVLVIGLNIVRRLIYSRSVILLDYFSRIGG